ncbi:MAG: hypothetical protein JWR04_1358 [Rhodoglobus sp.]|jgi:hypothetical protein|nr:hypothetical protein [Rhodoglobus sp.]
MGYDRRWIEPTRALPLRWGHYADRYAAGMLLIIGGGIQLQGSNTWTLPLLLIGTVAHATGWSIMPAAGWRRLVAVIPATGQLWILLSGPEAAWTFVVPYLCWLLVRHRPARSYITVLFPLANGFIVPQFFTEYTGMLATIAISMAVVIASAWLARLLASSANAQRSSVVL